MVPAGASLDPTPSALDDGWPSALDDGWLTALDYGWLTALDRRSDWLYCTIAKPELVIWMTCPELARRIGSFWVAKSRTRSGPFISAR